MSMSPPVPPPLPRLCEHCGKPKRLPPTFNYASRTHYETDPYCSRLCAEAAHELKAKPL